MFSLKLNCTMEKQLCRSKVIKNSGLPPCFSDFGPTKILVAEMDYGSNKNQQHACRRVVFLLWKKLTPSTRVGKGLCT